MREFYFPGPPKGRGRPSIWQGPLGKRFVEAVAAIQRERPSISKADAIRLLRKRRGFIWLKQYSAVDSKDVRYLEKKLQEAALFLESIPTTAQNISSEPNKRNRKRIKGTQNRAALLPQR
jgi:hypothetical protein